MLRMLVDKKDHIQAYLGSLLPTNSGKERLKLQSEVDKVVSKKKPPTIKSPCFKPFKAQKK